MDFLRRHTVDVFGILETRIKHGKARKIINHRFTEYSVLHNRTISNGRVWVVWNPRTVIVQALDFNVQYIHCLNWIVLGDFNMVRDVQERVSDSPPSLSDILDFNTCILRCGLDDLKSLGCDFTWANKQDEGARVWSKLDRALLNYPWLTSFSSSSAHFLPAGISDHSSCLVSIFEDMGWKPRFSFLNCWVEDPDYSRIIEEAWAIPAHGNAMFRFFAKLKNVRLGLRDLHRRKYSAIQRRILTARAALKDCQLQLQKQPTCPFLGQQEKVRLTDYMRLRGIEMNILNQKSKFSTIIHNDGCTKAFYARIRERRYTQIIGEVTGYRGTVRRGLDEVTDCFLEHYQHLLKSSQTVDDMDYAYIAQDTCVSIDEWPELLKPVQDTEVRSALAGIDPQKSPGPDGFSSAFFISTWELGPLCVRERIFLHGLHG
ncbi:hypothetical protein RND81_11G018700 [Saponaria officinalis]|uniref:Endonuclease/exonuclease/phosphatase domain-containing protein n=1 Tax=Saponaria officinalis TaxID=3572 RepID=A0AAW1HGW9_SAPOF